MTRDRDTHEDGLDRPGLVWQREAGQVEYTIWPERPVTIGREPTNTITIDSPFVSKAHAIFQFANGQYVIEDLQSANGTRVNGAPIESAVVEPGDVIEIGDQRFIFVDRSEQEAAPAKGLGKNAKLGLVAGGTVVVMTGLMMMLVASAPSNNARPPAAEARGGDRTPTAAPAPRSLVNVDAETEQIREVIARAAKAGVSPVDALFDEAMLQYRGGRLRDTVQMLTAVLARDPKHPVAAARLTEVRRELERAIVAHSGQAARAFSQLRYDEAVNEWEQVLLLADFGDSRFREAQTGIDRARQRGAR